MNPADWRPDIRLLAAACGAVCGRCEDGLPLRDAYTHSLPGSPGCAVFCDAVGLHKLMQYAMRQPWVAAAWVWDWQGAEDLFKELFRHAV